MKPIGEFTDEQLATYNCYPPGTHLACDLAAEVLRLRGEVEYEDTAQQKARAEKAEAERDEIIESYRELRDKCNDAYLQRDAWQVRANTAETKAAEWRDASFAVDAQLRHAQTERDALLEEVKDYEDSGLTEGRARYWRERAERAEAVVTSCQREIEIKSALAKERGAALARVRALCCGPGDRCRGCSRWDCDDLRAVIEGEL